MIGGLLRGQKMKALPRGHFTRPILARIRKSLFDILQFQIPGSRFLDLCSGTGIVGLEALSRGAETVVFVDKNPQCTRYIQEHIEKFLQHVPTLGTSRVLTQDIFRPLAVGSTAFNFIFSGAPYVDRHKKPLFWTADIARSIQKQNLLAAGGTWVAQHHVKEPPFESADWQLSRKEIYGDTQLSFFTLNQGH